MAEFMQGAVAKTTRRRKDDTASETPNADRESSTTSRTDDELAALAAQFHDVPRGQWPAEVLEYQRRQQREKKRSARVALEERREVEQARRREQLGNDDGNEGDNRQHHEGARYAKRTKRARDNAEYEATRVPRDLMTDDELAAARAAPLVAPDDDTARRIVERVRAALSDERQGERVCAVCDEIVLKRDSSIGRVCEQLVATMRHLERQSNHHRHRRRHHRQRLYDKFQSRSARWSTAS